MKKIALDLDDVICNGGFMYLINDFLHSNYTEKDVKTKFGALYNAFQYGAPPHAGIAPGVDRMLMLLTDSETVRDVIAFPMNSKSQDLLMGAPSIVTKEQLQDVHIKLDLPDKK